MVDDKMLRVAETLYERLERIAKANRRTNKAEAEIALEKHLDSEEKAA